MKRLIVLLAVCGLFLFPVFAEISGDIQLEKAETDSVEIKFDLTKDGGNSTWKIGFASDVTNLKESETVTHVDSAIALDLIENHGGLDNKNLYVYWIIKGGQKLNITLQAEGPLEGPYQEDESTSSTEYMNWKVSWTPSVSGDEPVSGESVLGTTDPYNISGQDAVDYKTAKPVFTREELDTSREVGSALLTITTQDIDRVKPASYAADLILTISPVGE